MLDRSKAPGAFPIEKIKFPSAKKYILKNGIVINAVNLGEQPVFKFELSTQAGGVHGEVGGLASLTAQLMKRGTSKHDALHIHQSFDFYGAFWDIQATLDQATFTVYGLVKHFGALMPYVAEMIQFCNFPRHEFQKELAIEIQKNKLNWEKTAYSASQIMRGKLFGNHPYGRAATPESLALLNDQDLITFYKKTWTGQQPSIFISGQISDHEIRILESTFSDVPYKTKEQSFAERPSLIESSLTKEIRDDAMQSSIRLGTLAINRKNEDYFKFSVLNTILGGFFGSRLQKNIREEKGFTYGISSSLIPMYQTGYWVVGTDVKNENVNETIDEVKKEMYKLREVLVSEEELSLVKNYLMGSFTGELTQAFDIAEKVKIMELEGLDADFYDQFQEQIFSCTPIEMRDLANKYLDPSTLTEVIVGGN
jgi:predicted Zn-dependent peptidase